jgi:GH24 family phage-related lysozyme (muramidase)
MNKPTLAELSSALIAVFEGPERLTSFQDSGGVWTIGRGHTAGVRQGVTITHDQSVALFAFDQMPLLDLVADKPLLAAAAYVSFGYNCGHGVLREVLRGIGSIEDPVHTTDRHGQVQPGLVSRRRLELLMIAAA